MFHLNALEESFSVGATALVRQKENPSEPLLEFAIDTSPISFLIYLTISDMPWLTIIISKLGYN